MSGFVGYMKYMKLATSQVAVALLEILPQRNTKSDAETMQSEIPGDVFFSRELQWLNLLRHLCRKVRAKKNAKLLPSEHYYKEKLL